jgi:hypothetical protein
MKKIIRFLVLLAVIVVGFYLLMTGLVIFAGLAAAVGLVWLYLRYFGKGSNVTYSSKGVTIDQVSASVPTPGSASEEVTDVDVVEELRPDTVDSEVEVKPDTHDVYALYNLYEIEARAYCVSPGPKLPTIVDDIIALTNHVDADDQLRAKTYRLLGELYEANDNVVSALDYYETALALDAKVGVKRKITKLQKMTES